MFSVNISCVSGMDASLNEIMLGRIKCSARDQHNHYPAIQFNESPPAIERNNVCTRKGQSIQELQKYELCL